MTEHRIPTAVSRLNRRDRRRLAKRRQPSGRRMAVSVAAGVTLGLSSLGTSAAGADSYQQMQHNIQGEAGGHNGSPVLLQAIKQGILYSDQSGDPPYAVSLNEVCYTQFLDLQNFLTTFYPGQYQTRFTTTRKVNLSDDCSAAYGNAIAVRGGVYSDPWPTGNPYPGQSGNEIRRLRCVQYGVFGPAFYVCNTHLTNNASVASGQLAYAFAWMNSWYATPGVLFMGDLNQTPNDNSIIQGAYSNYFEADHGCGSYGGGGDDSPTFSTVKFDYVFGSKGNAGTRFASCGLSRVYSSTYPSGQAAYSDHRMLGGNLNWG